MSEVWGETMRALALARKQLDELREKWIEAKADLDNLLNCSPENRRFLSIDKAMKETEALVRDREGSVRQEAEEAYRKTGNKRPWPGAEVRVLKTPVFERAALVTWCVTNAKGFLVIKPEMTSEMPLVDLCLEHGKTEWLAPDQTKIKKGAGLLADLGAPITFEERPTVAIASDLSGYLPSDKEDGNEQKGA